MTVQDWLLIIAAVGVVLVNLVTAWRTDAKVEAVQAVADVADVKLDKIHDLTNSNLDTVKKDLAAAYKEIAGLRELIQSIVEARVPLPVGVPVDATMKTKVQKT